MALNINNEYTPRVNAPDANFLTGSIKDETVPGVSNDGTPLSSPWGNDYVGFTDALLSALGIARNGLPDTALQSDRFNAIQSLILKSFSVGDGHVAKAGQRLTVDNSSGVAGVFLPTSPSNGDCVEVVGVTLYSTNNVNVSSTDKDIMVVSDNQCTLDDKSDGYTFKFKFDSVDDLWKISRTALEGSVI